VSVNVEMGGVQ